MITPISNWMVQFLLVAMASPSSILLTNAFATTRRPNTRLVSQLNAEQEPFQGTVVACNGPTCTQKGGKKALVWLEELAPEGVTIETVNCVSECAECGLGPNVELRAEGDSGPFFPIENKITSKEQVKEILRLPVEVTEE